MRSRLWSFFFGACVLANFAAAEGNCNDKPVVEVVTFSLATSSVVTDLRVSAAAVDKELRKMPGFKSRRLMQSDGSGWVDMVQWKNLSSAKSAAQKMQDNPVALAFFAHIDPASVTINYYCE